MPEIGIFVKIAMMFFSISEKRDGVCGKINTMRLKQIKLFRIIPNL